NFEFNALGNRWISWDTVENAFQYHLRILAIQPPSFTVLERFHITPWGDPYLNLAHIGWGGVALEDMFFMFEAVSTLNAIYFGSEVFNYANRNFSLETAPSNFRIEDGYVKWTPIRIEGVYHIQHFNVSVSHPMAGFEVSYTGDSTSVELDGFFDFLYDVLDYDVPITISIVALGFEYDVDETKTFFARSERQYIVFYLKDIQ
ncbi:MAG: hypothetical protein FWC11_06375, partial [Firmicutes bacterium]|nr:hypothetical protein [Bacillota bacterium]